MQVSNRRSVLSGFLTFLSRVLFLSVFVSLHYSVDCAFSLIPSNFPSFFFLQLCHFIVVLFSVLSSFLNFFALFSFLLVFFSLTLNSPYFLYFDTFSSFCWICFNLPHLYSHYSLTGIFSSLFLPLHNTFFPATFIYQVPNIIFPSTVQQFLPQILLLGPHADEGNNYL